MKTTVMLLVFFTLFSRNIFAQGPSQWHLPEGAKARLGKGKIHEIQYSPDGTRLAVAGPIGIWLYDTGTYQEIALLTGHTSWINSIAFSTDGRTLASGSWDNTVRLSDALTGAHQKTLTGHTGVILSIAFSPDSTILASGGGDRDNTIRLWDVLTGHQKTLTGHTDGVSSIAFSPDGGTLASGGSWNDDTVRLWDTTTGELKATLAGHPGGVYSVAYSPDGETLASGGYKEIRLWDAVTGAHQRTLIGHRWNVYSVVFSPDGDTLISGSEDANHPSVGCYDGDTPADAHRAYGFYH